MKKLTKTQKIIRWAAKTGSRTISKAIKETKQTEKQFMNTLRSLRRNGIINFEKINKRVYMNLTKDAYYNRKYFVV